MQVYEGRPARPSVNTVCPLSGYWQHWRHHDNIMLREGDISGRAGTGVCCRWSAAEAEAGGGEDTSAVVAVRLRTPASMVSPSPVCPVSPSPHPQHPGDKCPHWPLQPESGPSLHQWYTWSHLRRQNIKKFQQKFLRKTAKLKNCDWNQIESSNI